MPACRDPFSFPLRAGLTSAGERAPSSSTAVASGLLVGGFAVTWLCTTSSSGGKVPPNVQRNINGKPAPQKRRRQPLCRALRCPVLAPSFGKTGASLDLDWPELEPDCPGRPTDKQQHSINLGRPGLDKLTTDNSNRDPFLFALAFSKFGHILSITIHPSILPLAIPPPVSGFFSSQGTDQANSVHTSSITTAAIPVSLYTTLFAATCPSPRLLSTLISLLVHRYCVGPSPPPLPRPPLPAVPHVALGCHEASRPQSIDGTPGSLAVLPAL